MNKLPIYKMTINPDDESGVSFVALVDDPATHRNWFAFNKQMKFKADPSRKIITGALMVADLPIYRMSKDKGEYYVVFDAPVIEQIVQKYFRQGNTSNVNLMHDAEAQVQGVYMFESFIVDKSRGIQAPVGFDGITEGSWIGSFKVDNEAVWNNFIKTGEFKGFSVEGMFDLQLEQTSVEDQILQVIEEISKL